MSFMMSLPSPAASASASVRAFGDGCGSARAHAADSKAIARRARFSITSSLVNNTGTSREGFSGISVRKIKRLQLGHARADGVADGGAGGLGAALQEPNLAEPWRPRLRGRHGHPSRA